MDLEIPIEVSIRGPLLVKVPQLKYVYFKIQDEAQFLELCFDSYAEDIPRAEGKISVVTGKWAKPLEKSRIISLLDFPRGTSHTSIRASGSYSVDCI
jgi:hypothetical protein